jgi:hypothetical protein
MILKKQLDAFRYLFNTHVSVKEVLVCEPWEIEGHLKPGLLYQLIVITPVSTLQTLNSLQRTYRIICMDTLTKDKSNEEDVLNDCEYVLNKFITLLRDQDDVMDAYGDITLINEPLLEPFKEEFGDWNAGYTTEVVIESGFDNNHCITLRQE